MDWYGWLVHQLTYGAISAVEVMLHQMMKNSF
jgi:hypothetical protein